MDNLLKRMFERKGFKEDFWRRVQEIHKQQQGEHAELGGPGSYEAFKGAAGEVMEMIAATQEFRQLVRAHRLSDDQAGKMLLEAVVKGLDEFLSPPPEQN